MRKSPAYKFIDANMRGLGQIMLQDNPVTGMLFLLGICVSDWRSGLYALLGTGVSTATASLLGAARDEVGHGLYGFNGTLTGIALASHLRQDATLPIYIAAAAMFATITTAAIKSLSIAQGRPLTGPFVITTWFFVAGQLGHGHAAAVPSVSPGHGGVLGLDDAFIALLNGLAQITLQQSAWTGFVFLVALAIASRIACVAAGLGSALGLGVGWMLDAPASDLRDGLYGFNAALTAIALSSSFHRLDRATVLLTVLATCVSTVAYVGFRTILDRAGLPVLTAPFVATTWLCLLASPSLTRLRTPSPTRAAGPNQAPGSTIEVDAEGGPPCPRP